MGKPDRKPLYILGFLGILMLMVITVGTVAYTQLYQRVGDVSSANLQVAALQASVVHLQSELQKMTVGGRHDGSFLEACGLVCKNGGSANRDCTACANCDPGWHGQLCNTPVQCEPLQCAQGNVDGTSCQCQCVFGWTGDQCDELDPGVTPEVFRQWLLDTMGARPSDPLTTREGFIAYEPAVGRSVHTSKHEKFGARVLQLAHNPAGPVYYLSESEALLLPSTSAGPLVVTVAPVAKLVPETKATTGQNLNAYVTESFSFGSGFRSSLANVVMDKGYQGEVLKACGPDYSFVLEEQAFPFFHAKLPTGGDQGYNHELDAQFSRILQSAGTDPERLRMVLDTFGDSVVVESYEGAWLLDLKLKTEDPARSCQLRFQHCEGGASSFPCPVPSGLLSAWLRSSMKDPAHIKYRTQPLYMFIKDPAVRRALQIVHHSSLEPQSTMAAGLCVPCSSEGSCEAPSLQCACKGAVNGASCSICPPGLLQDGGRCRKAEIHTFQLAPGSGQQRHLKNLHRATDKYTCIPTTSLYAHIHLNGGGGIGGGECSVIEEGGYWHLLAASNAEQALIKCFAACFLEA